MRLHLLLFSCSGLLRASKAENEEVSSGLLPSDTTHQNEDESSALLPCSPIHHNEDLSSALLSANLTLQSLLDSSSMKFLPKVFVNFPKFSLTSSEQSLTCTACTSAVGAMIELFLLGASVEQVEQLAMGLCNLLGVIDEGVCHGAVYNYAPQIKHIVTHSHPHVKAAEVCAMLLGKGCGSWEYVNDWTVDLPHGDKPEPEEIVAPPKDAPSIQVLHVSDIHIDLNYEVGSSAECGLPMCCSKGAGPAPSEDKAAKYWGDYNCDLPKWTFRNMMEQVRDNHKVDYIMLTGDFPAHDVWLQSRQDNINTTNTVVNIITEVFPDTQVVTSMGNHEVFPCNNLPANDVDAGPDSPTWLYDALADAYSHWLPEDQINQLRKRGAYSLQLRPGFRVLSINSPMCLTYNFFTWMDWSDPGNMLDWLVAQLKEAEDAGDRVHILSHVPPGGLDCLGAWGREFSKIVNRFENTVVGQFYGHTHNDEFQVFYDTETNSRATNVAFVTPSVTTHAGLNPSYRIYTIDAGHDDATFRVKDHDTYVFNMDEANAAGEEAKPSWYRLASVKDDLEVEAMFPGQWDKLVRRLATDDDMYEKWLRFYNNDGKGFMDLETKRDKLCCLLTTSNLDKRKCDEILGSN